MSSSESISDSLDDAEWELIVHALKQMDCGVEGRCAKTRRLRAKLGIIRQILTSEISQWNGNRSIEGSMFVSSLKSIRSAEREFESLGIKKTDFIIFLGLLLNKFSRQKLLVKKPHATQSEFRKMKGVVEDEEHAI